MSGFWDLWSDRIRMACFLPNAVHLMQFLLFHICCGWFDVVEHLRTDVQEKEESDNSYILRCTGNGIVLLKPRKCIGHGAYR
jgi:hypothetical protein